ncbi:MAG: NAD(+)/NADH kinase [archaeon]
MGETGMKLLIGYMQTASHEHIRTMRKLRTELERYPDIEARWKDRNHITLSDTKRADVVITVGGDGTLLSISHQISDDTPVLGINSDPKNKEGALTRATRASIPETIRAIVEKEYTTQPIQRLSAVKGHRKLEPALNEVFFGNELAWRTSRYEVRIGKKRERQMSSGLIMSTAAGSTGWAASMDEKPIPIGSKKIRYLVREPTKGRICGHSLIRKTLKTGGKVTITSLDDYNIAIADSVGKPVRVRKGETLTIMAAAQPLQLIRLKR